MKTYHGIVLLIGLLTTLTVTQAQITVDLEQCQTKEHHLAWGLGTEHTKVLGLETFEQVGFQPETVCALEHITELEGGYMAVVCRFPTRYREFRADQEFNIQLADRPLTTHEAIRYCQLIKSGNVFIDMKNMTPEGE